MTDISAHSPRGIEPNAASSPTNNGILATMAAKTNHLRLAPNSSSSQCTSIQNAWCATSQNKTPWQHETLLTDWRSGSHTLPRGRHHEEAPHRDRPQTTRECVQHGLAGG